MATRWIQCALSLSSLVILYWGIFLNPPFQSPDEPHHYFRAYQLSEGKIIASEQAGEVGGYLPRNVVEFGNSFTFLRWIDGGKLSRSAWWNSLKERPAESIDGARVFDEFSNTALYSPVVYLPQSAGLFLARLMNASLLQGFYLARFLTSFTAILVWWFSIMRLTGISLARAAGPLLIYATPMVLFQSGSLSADALTLALSAACATSGINLNRSKKDFYLFLFLCALLSLSKSAYSLLPLVFLPSLFQASKGQSRLQRTAIPLMFLAAVVLPALLWSLAIEDVMSSQKRGAVINVGEHVAYLKSNFFGFCAMALKQLCRDFGALMIQAYGHCKGVREEVQVLITIFFYSLFGFTTLYTLRCLEAPDRKYRLHQLWSSVIIFGSFFGIWILNFVFATPPGFHGIDGIQGRYFWPIVLFAFAPLFKREIKTDVFPRFYGGLIFFWSLVSLLEASRTLVERYWKT